LGRHHASLIGDATVGALRRLQSDREKGLGALTARERTSVFRDAIAALVVGRSAAAGGDAEPLTQLPDGVARLVALAGRRTAAVGDEPTTSELDALEEFTCARLGDVAAAPTVSTPARDRRAAD
jgi:hypothetical protein